VVRTQGCLQKAQLSISVAELRVQVVETCVKL
jgi:hypothetical protein